jgi:hypothetical protein
MTKEQWLKIGKGGLIALAGALIVWLPTVVTDVEWGIWTPFAVAASSFLVNALKVFTQQ